MRAIARIAVVPDPTREVVFQSTGIRGLAVSSHHRRLLQDGGRFQKNHGYRSERS